jgi:hypothetical protein
MDVEDDEPGNEHMAKERLGRKAQVGGGLAVFIGALLFAFFPAAPSGTVPDLHQMAKLFIGFGGFLLAAGTLARWFFLD